MRRHAVLGLVACAGLAAPACASVLGADFDGLQPNPMAGTGGEGGGGTSNDAGHGGADLGGPALPLVCGDRSGLQAKAPWPMEGYCPTRQARSEGASFASAKLRWKAKLDGPIYTEPIIAADGTVLVVTFDLEALAERLHAVRDGVEVWFFPLTAGGSPAIGSDGTIYVFDASRVVALRPDGSKRWEAPINGLGSPVIRGDGSILVPSTAGLSAVRSDGSIAWSTPTAEPLGTPAAVGLDGTIYVGSLNGTLYAMSPDGELRWALPTGEVAESPPVVGGADRVYFATRKRVHAIDAAGKERWTFSVGAVPTATPVVLGKTLFTIAADEQYQHSLWALDDSGVPLWSQDKVGLSGRLGMSKLGVLAGTVLNRAGMAGPEIVARLPGSGALLWSVDGELQAPGIRPGVAWGDDGVIYAAFGEVLYAIEAAP